jgi:hypothetical protein
MLLQAIDLGATFVFAISGATQGVRHRLDLFGVLVVACASAVAGGVARDLLIGIVPPVAVADWRYLTVAAAAGLLGFVASGQIARLKMPVLLFDAAGLSLFAVSGAASRKRWSMARSRPWPRSWALSPASAAGSPASCSPCSFQRSCGRNSMLSRPWPGLALLRWPIGWGLAASARHPVRRRALLLPEADGALPRVAFADRQVIR